MNFKIKHLLSVFSLVLGTTSVFAQNETDSPKHFAVKLYSGYSISNETSVLQVVGGEFNMSDAATIGGTFSWFYNKNWSAELSMSTAKYTMDMINGDYTNIDMYRYDLELGSVWTAPLSLSARYHLSLWNKMIPYASVGATYVLFTNVDPGWAAKEVTYTNKPAINFGIGVDYNLNDRWFLNLEARKFFTDRSDVNIDFTNSTDWSIEAQLQPQPLNITMGLGFRF
jgi:outer membrane protein